MPMFFHSSGGVPLPDLDAPNDLPQARQLAESIAQARLQSRLHEAWPLDDLDRDQERIEMDALSQQFARLIVFTPLLHLTSQISQDCWRKLKKPVSLRLPTCLFQGIFRDAPKFDGQFDIANLSDHIWVCTIFKHTHAIP